MHGNSLSSVDLLVIIIKINKQVKVKKLQILSSVKDQRNKKWVAYTPENTYASGHLIPNSVYPMTKLGIKYPLCSISKGVSNPHYFYFFEP